MSGGALGIAAHLGSVNPRVQSLIAKGTTNFAISLKVPDSFSPETKGEEFPTVRQQQRFMFSDNGAQVEFPPLWFACSQHLGLTATGAQVTARLAHKHGCGSAQQMIIISASSENIFFAIFLTTRLV